MTKTEPTDRQIAYLRHLGYDGPTELTQEQVSMEICNRTGEKRDFSASPEQIEFLRNLDYTEGRTLTQEQADNLIDELLAAEAIAGVRLRCPACSGIITKRPKRAIKCPDCHARLTHFCGQLYTPEQEADWRRIEAQHKDEMRLRYKRMEVLNDVFGTVRGEISSRREGFEHNVAGFLVKIGRSCPASAPFHRLYIPVELAESFPQCLPPYDGDCSGDCRCRVESVRATPRNAGLLQSDGSVQGRTIQFLPPIS